MSKDFAETGQLQRLLGDLGSSLDTFLQFKHNDAQRDAEHWQSDLAQSLPEQGIGIDAVNQRLMDTFVRNGSAVPNPAFCGYITTGGVTASTLALTAANVCSPQRYLLTAFNLVEELSLSWLAEMFQLGEMKGVYSSGGSVANLIALGGARQWAYEQAGTDPAQAGMLKPARIYASDQCHHTIQRAAGVLGIGRRAVRVIETDAASRMRTDRLEQAVKEDLRAGFVPVAIVANAGTTNTGAFDPLREIGNIARRYNIWYHIDGAYGLPGILDTRKAALFDGLELADSVIIDPHKWLGACVGVAATFVRDRDILRRAFMQEPADYLEGSVEADIDYVPQHSLDGFGIPYFDYGVELSSPARGVAVWSMLQEIGVEGMRARIIRHNDMAADLARKVIAHPQLELLQEPTLSICCFRFTEPSVHDLNAFNKQLVRRMTLDNQAMPTTTRIGDKFAIRPCFIGARHEPIHVDRLLAEVIRVGCSLLEKTP